MHPVIWLLASLALVSATHLNINELTYADRIALRRQANCHTYNRDYSEVRKLRLTPTVVHTYLTRTLPCFATNLAFDRVNTTTLPDALEHSQIQFLPSADSVARVAEKYARLAFFRANTAHVQNRLTHSEFQLMRDQTYAANRQHRAAVDSWLQSSKYWSASTHELWFGIGNFEEQLADFLDLLFGAASALWTVDAPWTASEYLVDKIEFSTDDLPFDYTRAIHSVNTLIDAVATSVNMTRIDSW